MARNPAAQNGSGQIVAVFVTLMLASLSCARPQASSRDALAQTVSPHGAVEVDCASCHQPAGWSPLRTDLQFDHARDTRFELSGAHADVDCRSCHLRLRFEDPHTAGGRCGACHVDVHSGQLGTSCALCHDTRSFAASGRRDAHAGTSFPLAGRHRQIACEACHSPSAEQRFAPLPTTCMSCHQPQYAVAVPDHRTAGFSTDCAGCHGVFGWSRARFEHARQTGYPLEGAHSRIDCASCHAPPDFALRYAATGPRDCISCHRDDYDRVHPSMGFAADCLTCHTLETFRGARWAEHEARFPIASGPHARASCAQCHTEQRFTTVSCLSCHEHSKARMDDKHDERAGYSYTTAACLTCHPRGRTD